MKLKIAYWVLTGLLGLLMAFSGWMYISGASQAVEGFRHLGYPDYFRTLLGIAKLLGVVALLVPGVPRTLREWAYAGFAINLVSAAVSHAGSGDPVGRVVSPLVVLALFLTSHQLWRRVSAAGSAARQPAAHAPAA